MNRVLKGHRLISRAEAKRRDEGSYKTVDLEVPEYASNPEYNPRISMRARRRQKNLVGHYLPHVNRKRRRTRIESQHARARASNKGLNTHKSRRTTPKKETLEERAYEKAYGKQTGIFQRIIEWWNNRMERMRALRP